MTVRPHSRLPALLAVAIVAGAYMGGATAQWAWKEDNGRVVYSDRPPPPNVKTTQILRQPNVAMPDPAPRAAAQSGGEGDKPAAAPAAAPAAPKSIAEREMEFRKRQQERADGERKAQQEEQKAAAKAADCERTRGYVRALEDGVRISRTDASGNREFLDDGQRAAELERARKTVQQVCN